MCMSIKAPTRDIGDEAGKTLAAQIELAPKQYEAAAKYDPLFTDLNTANYKRMLEGAHGNDGLLAMYERSIAPAMSRANQAGATIGREGDVADLERYGQRAVSAIQGSNPQQRDLMAELNRQAMGELQQGATLDPSLRRQVQQSVRAGQSARGMGLGTNDVASEALFSGLRAEQLRQSRRQFAQQVAGMNSAQAVDPLLAIVGRPSQANPQLLNMGAQAGAAGTPSFDPFNPYAQDYWNTTYNARAGAKIAGNNANAALWGKVIESGSNIAGAAIGCWVAREVYGEEKDPAVGELKWKVFRHWMLEESPREFRTMYLAHGEEFAKFIADKPMLKTAVKRWMDNQIAEWRAERDASRERGDVMLAKGEY